MIQQPKPKSEVRAFIESVGIVPVIRACSVDEALFAANAIAAGGIPIAEITMTVPGALDVIQSLVKNAPSVLVGAGTVLNADAAEKCIAAGAKFLVSPGFNPGAVSAAKKHGIPIMAGALTPTEVMAAWDAGADFIKVFPCGNLGGPNYIKALKGPFPQIPMVPTGGVNLQTAADYLKAGASALGVGGELVLKHALKNRDTAALTSLTKQFVQTVASARAQSNKT